MATFGLGCLAGLAIAVVAAVVAGFKFYWGLWQQT